MSEPIVGRGALVVPLLITAAGNSLPVRGEAAGLPEAFRDGALAWEDGALTFVGPASELPAEAGEPEVLDLGVTVVPGFVDAHTHLPFFGWRADEFERRLSGTGYRELHGEGGIPRSARMLAEASDSDVLEFSLRLAREMATHGTTALELKTGYGLSVEGELRQIRLARRLSQLAPQTCTVTLLACHAVPHGVERRDWVATACDELIPRAASEGLADAVDIYVEDIAFDLDDLQAVAEAAAAARLPLRVHADQLGNSEAAAAAAGLGARTADHLNHASGAGIQALGEGETVAVLLPASTFFLRSPVPPVSELLETGAPIAIATDCNPGTSPVASMPEGIAMACTLYGIPPLAALTAATSNPAWALGLADRLGSLEAGKRADFLVLEGDDFRQVPYRPGHNPVMRTYVGGRQIGPAGSTPDH
jgi:imidazolonepropionase